MQEAGSIEFANDYARDLVAEREGRARGGAAQEPRQGPAAVDGRLLHQAQLVVAHADIGPSTGRPRLGTIDAVDHLEEVAHAAQSR